MVLVDQIHDIIRVVTNALQRFVCVLSWILSHEFDDTIGVTVSQQAAAFEEHQAIEFIEDFLPGSMNHSDNRTPLGGKRA